MTDPVEPTQVVAPDPQKPAVEPPVVEEVFDKERAMALITKLRGEVKSLEPKAKKADDLEAAEKARKEAELPEIERLKKETHELQSQLKKLQITQQRNDVAHKIGLPDVFADRIKGETPEEMEADAKLIFDALPKGPKPPPPVNPTNPGGASANETDAQIMARLHPSGANMWNPEVARRHGGGVVAPEPKP
jgi:hypothetical protein